MERYGGVIAVPGELDLKLTLIFAHGLLADRAGFPKAWAAPRSISGLGGNAPVTD
jgi:hypothetical protein